MSAENGRLSVTWWPGRDGYRAEFAAPIWVCPHAHKTPDAAAKCARKYLGNPGGAA